MLWIKVDSLENTVKTLKIDKHNKQVEPTLDNVFERSEAFKEMRDTLKRKIEDKMDAKEWFRRFKDKWSVKDVHFLIHRVKSQFAMSLSEVRDEQYKFHQHALK